MQRERRLELIRAITIVNQMAGALGAAHAKGIVHRDLKPENVMLTKREGRRELIRQISDESGLHVITEREKAFDFVKILDFGVAKVRDPDVSEARVTQQGVVFGTPEYMAPETARIGVSDPRTDIYALGVIFYEMLTGTVPFTGETPVDVMLKVVSEPVTPPRDRAPGIEITHEAEQLIMKALSKDPLRRQQSMEELHEELQRCYGSVRYRRSIERSAAASRPPLQRTDAPGRRHHRNAARHAARNAARCATMAPARAPRAPRRSSSPARRSVRAGRPCRSSFSPTRRPWKNAAARRRRRRCRAARHRDGARRVVRAGAPRERGRLGRAGHRRPRRDVWIGNPEGFPMTLPR